MALPKTLILGPTWLLPAFIAVSLAPTIVAHRMGRPSFNHVLGIVNSSIITLALIGSVMLLVKALPSHQEEPVRLLVSGAALWLTNVLVFTLWYWRLDGGGPTVREKNPELVNTAFVFPQMQIEKIERKRFSVEHWRLGFVDYLFIAFSQLHLRANRRASLADWAKFLAMVQVFISLCIVILLIPRAVGVL